MSPQKPESVQAQNNCSFVSPTLNSQVAPHFSGCPAASSVASGLFLFSSEVKWGGTSKFIHHHPKTQDSGQESPGPDKAWVTPTVSSLGFWVPFPTGSTPSFTHQGHAPRCPRNWGGGAPSKKEGRWPWVSGAPNLESPELLT